MGIFDGFKKARGEGLAAQAAAAQQFANQQSQQAGYTDGSPVTSANAAQVSEGLQNDHAVINAYGEEYKRILAVGTPASAVIVDRIDTGERTSGIPWYLLELDVTAPGAAPYRVQRREFIGPQTLAAYEPGTTRPIRVDPTDPHVVAFDG